MFVVYFFGSQFRLVNYFDSEIVRSLSAYFGKTQSEIGYRIGSPERMPAQSPVRKQGRSPELKPAQSPEMKQATSPERIPALKFI